MFNNFQLDNSIDHGMSMSSNSHYEQLHAQQHQYPPDPQPPMSSINHSASASNTPASSSTPSNTQEAGGTPGPSSASIVPPKPAYGSGEPDDGYTLVFGSLAEFQAWKEQEEEEKVVEFVKGDTHGSKAVPPRFKDHTKLVCARHTRSGRKKYVKKYPERQRKLPSRKIEGEGCPASISYKTFYHTEEVRACYNDKHSHEIGEANLLFTRRGRKAAQDKGKVNALRNAAGLPISPTQTSSTPSPLHEANSVASHAANSTTVPQQQDALADPTALHPGIAHAAMSLLPAASVAAVSEPPDTSQDRWDRMSVLFASIRQHARGFEYPGPSVAALESVLIRLYLESPLTAGLGAAGSSMEHAA